MYKMSHLGDVNPLPPGWDSKYDSSTGKKYFINYFTRNTSLEDPRLRQRQFIEDIPMQDLSGCRVDRHNHSVLDNQVKTTSMEESVAKISAVFPTVGETHIKMLLLKYLKSVFPVVEETLLLDTLCNSDNNVHQASETLLNMGFDKRATPPPRVSLQKRDVSHSVKIKPIITPRIKSIEEKEKMKVCLKEKHPNTEERIISIALDSVDYDEDKADQILSMMNDDKPKATQVSSVEASSSIIGKTVSNSWDQIVSSPPSPEVSTPVVASSHQRQKGKQDFPKITQNINKCNSEEFKSHLLIEPRGPNRCFHKGPNDNLLLSDYVTWVGPNPKLVKGPNKTNLGRSLTPWGPDPKLRKGPVMGLAKGSIYTRLSRLTLNETRGK